MSTDASADPKSNESQSTQSKNGERSPLIVIFLTVFIDLLGFGIIIPLSPFLAREFNASAFEIGFLLAIYSIFQFLFSPFWGSLSDRIGRRPTLLISLSGAVLSYILFAFSPSLTLLFVSRGLAGAFGGNISTAHAYIADVTSAKDRSKGMGLIGAAFGLGFIFGPLIGGGLAILGQKIGSQPPFGMSFPALGAAVLCAGNTIFAYFKLKESLPPHLRRTRSSELTPKKRFLAIYGQLRRPVAGPLVFVFFLSGLAMAQMEAMLFPLVADRFGWGLEMASLGFAYVGVLMVITQGWLIRKVIPIFGEPLVLSVGLGLFALSLFGIAASSSIAAMTVAMTVLAFGNGFMRPPNLGIISLMTPPNEQGAAMGVTNSLASLGRIFGPILGGWAYENVGQGAPFGMAGVVTLLAFAVVVFIYRRLPSSGRGESNV